MSPPFYSIELTYEVPAIRRKCRQRDVLYIYLPVWERREVLKPVLGGVRIVALSISSHLQTQ